MFNFIESYLKHRSQSTDINNVLSECEVLNVQIPQDSCFSPSLFPVCILYKQHIFS